MEEMKLPFTVVDMNIYVENTKAVIKKLLKLIKTSHRTEQQAKRHERYFTE